MDFKEVIERLNEIKIKREKLKGELNDLDRMEEDYSTFLNISAVFDEALIQSISELLSIKEKESYVPFMYKSYSSLFSNGAYSVQNTCLGITKYNNIPMFTNSQNYDELFRQKYGYDMILLNTELLDKEEEEPAPYIGLYSLSDNYCKKVFTFDFLLKQFGELSEFYPVRICKSNFEDYTYVQDYIRYLFDLQIKRKGKRLNYKEMQVAMADYLAMHEGKVKTKKLS